MEKFNICKLLHAVKKGNPLDVIKIRHQITLNSSHVVRLLAKREALVQSCENVMRKKFIMLKTTQLCRFPLRELAMTSRHSCVVSYD